MYKVSNAQLIVPVVLIVVAIILEIAHVEMLPRLAVEVSALLALSVIAFRIWRDKQVREGRAATARFRGYV